MIGNILPGWPLAIILFIIGLFGCISQRNILKTIISVNIMGLAAIILLISANYKPENLPPISSLANEAIADPVPQALMITAIVIGIAVTAVALALLIRVVRRYGTADWAVIIKRLNR